MAVDKKSFVLYSDLIHTVSKMPNDKAGELFKHILSYVNDEQPKTDDLIIQLTFEPIRQQLKRDLKKYEDKKKQWSEAGKRSAEVRKANKNQRTLTTVKNVATDSTVNDNVSVNDIIYKKKNIAYNSDAEFLEDWNAARKSMLGVQSNMKSLHHHESKNLNILIKTFSKEDFKNGMRGLMNQKDGILPAMQLRPDHFLKDLNIEKYIDAHLNKKQLYSDNKQKNDRL